MDGAAAQELAHATVVELRFLLLSLLRLQTRLRLGDLGAAGRGQRPTGHLLEHPLRLLQLPRGDGPLRGEVALLQSHERLPGLDRVALADADIEDASAHPRAHLDRVGLDGAAPFERGGGSSNAITDVDREREDDDEQRNDSSLHELPSFFMS